MIFGPPETPTHAIFKKIFIAFKVVLASEIYEYYIYSKISSWNVVVVVSYCNFLKLAG